MQTIGNRLETIARGGALKRVAQASGSSPETTLGLLMLSEMLPGIVAGLKNIPEKDTTASIVAVGTAIHMTKTLLGLTIGGRSGSDMANVMRAIQIAEDDAARRMIGR